MSSYNLGKVGKKEKMFPEVVAEVHMSGADSTLKPYRHDI
jgi:hypothetical protein